MMQLSAISGKRVVEQARTWIDTPYRHQSAVKGLGCDCIGLVRGVSAELNLSTFDEKQPEHRKHLRYSRAPKPGEITKVMDKFMVRIESKDKRPGDVILFAVPSGPVEIPMHLGIYSGERETVIHACNKSRKVVEARYDGVLRVVAAWCYPVLVGL